MASTTAAPAPTECDVCCRGFTKVSRKQVPCQSPDCHFAACSDCVKTYLLDQAEPKCMSCPVTWTRSHIVAHLGVTWTKNHLLTAQAKVLLNQQLALLPTNMEEASFAKKTAEHRARLKDLRKAQRSIQDAYAGHVLTGEVTQAFADMLGNPELSKIPINTAESIAAVNTAYRARLTQYNHEILREQDSAPEKPPSMTSAVTGENQQHVACPVTGCRGFANGNWRCGVCEVRICQDCHEQETEADEAKGIVGHVCDKNVLENVRLIAADTKLCPSCNTPIHKISGCDQMWCTKCFTAFSWRTGKIERGLVHNPHYYAARDAAGGAVRNPGDIPCGGLPDGEQLRRFYKRMIGMMSLVSTTMLDDVLGLIDDEDIIRDSTRQILKLERLCQIVCGLSLHANELVRDLDDLRESANANNERLRKLRVKYITGDVKTEADYLRRLKTHLTQAQRDLEIMQVLEMVIPCVVERMRLICEDERVARVSAVWLNITSLVNTDAPSKTDEDPVFPMTSGQVVRSVKQSAVKLDILYSDSAMEAAFAVRDQEATVVCDVLKDMDRYVREMTGVLNYADEQLQLIGSSYNYTPEPICVETSAMTIQVPEGHTDEMLSRGVILPNYSHPFVRNIWVYTEPALIHSNLARSICRRL